MKLTTRQERMVTSFLRKTAEALKDLPAEQRAESIARIRNRVQRELRAVNQGELDDESVAKLLLRSRRAVQGEGTHNPTNGNDAAARAAAAQTQEQPQTEPAPRESTGRRQTRKHRSRSSSGRSRGARTSGDSIWLGVCDDLAQAARVSPGTLRTVAVVAGLFTGPMALWAYLGAYIAIDPRRRLRDHGVAVSLASAKVVGWIAILYFAAWGIQVIVRRVYETYASAMLETNAWLWLEQYEARMAIAVFLTAMPLALLGALPMPNDWNVSLRRWGQAVIAIYALALFAGLICVAIGAGIQGVENFIA